MLDDYKSGMSTARESCKGTELKCCKREQTVNKFGGPEPQGSPALTNWSSRDYSHLQEIGSNMYIEDREEYFSVFLEAAISTMCQCLWLLCQRRKQLTGSQLSHPKPANVHPAKGLLLVRLDVFHLVCQLQKALWQVFQQHQRLKHGALQFYQASSCIPWREDLWRPLRFRSDSCVNWAPPTYRQLLALPRRQAASRN